MNTVAVIAGVILGGALVAAGASKLAAGPAWPVQAAGMGVRGPVVVAVPWIELLIGALTAVRIAAPWPAVAAALLLLVFSALIGRLLAQGKHPPCACFGAWSAKPIGPGHLVRNGVLLVAAAVAIVA